MQLTKNKKKAIKRYLLLALAHFLMIGGVLMFVCSTFSFAWAKPPIPVDALKLSVQDEEVLRAAVLPTQTKTVAHWVWRENPLSLTLPLNQEKRLIFPEPVQVDVNGQLTTDQLHVINDHQSVYLTALKSFEQKTRLVYHAQKQSSNYFFGCDDR